MPGPRLDLRLVGAVARAVGTVVVADSAPVSQLEALLDGWAGLSPSEAPGDQPAVILPCAAVASYGEVGAVRPDWWPDEMAKLRRAAADSRWRVREVVARALQRLLEADWSRTLAALEQWADDADPFVVRAAAAGVAEPRLLKDPDAAAAALDVQRIAVERYRSVDPDQRRDEGAKALRKALGFSVSVALAAVGEAGLPFLDELAASDDRDIRWIARENSKKSRVARLLRPR